jgi:alpha-1,6-mannosyltransferase
MEQPSAEAESSGDGREHLLGVAALTGFVGTTLVLVGVTTSASPFALNSPGAWFFGVPARERASTAATNGDFLGVVAVYAGILILLATWLNLVRSLRERPDAPVRRLVPVFIAWVLPVLAMPPIFSHDVYVYAAEGQMVSNGINPYEHGPVALGGGRFFALVDPIWQHAVAAYGPVWERLSGGVVLLTRHDVLAAIVSFRVLALVGVAGFGWGVPVLARSFGRSGAMAFALAVLNPLTLLILLGGAHNDALMLGLLVVGCVIARSGHPLPGLLCCALAGQIKIPALLGAVYIGWWWASAENSRRARTERFLGAGAISAGAVALLSVACDLGWHWLRGVSNTGVVVSWLDPATAVGLLAGHVASALGLGVRTNTLIDVSRGAGLALAGALAVALLLRSNRVGPFFALGWSMLALALLGPDVWPWYETWGIVLLAVVAERRTLWIVIALSAGACFTVIPTGQFLRDSYPAVTALVWGALLCALGAFCAVQVHRPGHRETAISADLALVEAEPGHRAP